MGKPGRKRKPLAVLGDTHHAKYGRGDELEVESSLPDAPAGMAGEALECWRWLVPKLHTFGILNSIDQKTLARYCGLWSEWEDVIEFIQEHGHCFDVFDINGNKIRKRYPESALMISISSELLKIETQFGMTPASRPEIPAVPKGQEEDFVTQMMKASRMN